MADVYLITNSVNGKKYVGVTSRGVARRFLEHQSDARRGSEQPLHRAIQKYGADNFRIQVVLTCDLWDDACLVEQQQITEHRTYDGRYGYNASRGGEGTFGIDRSYMHGLNNPIHRPGGSDHIRGERNHMRRPEHRERMRGDANPARQPGAMDGVRGENNPAKRPDVRAKIKAYWAGMDPAQRQAISEQRSLALKGRVLPWVMGDKNPSKNPAIREKKRGAGNPNARAVLIHGVRYGTLQEAATAVGVIQATTITVRIRRGDPGYAYAGD